MRRVLVPKSLALAENWQNCQETACFVLILTTPVEPIFQSAGPIYGHTALQEHCERTVHTTQQVRCGADISSPNRHNDVSAFIFLI